MTPYPSAEIWEYEDGNSPRLLGFWDAISAGTDPTDLYYEVPVLWLNTNNIGLYKGPAYPTIQAIFTGGYSGGVSL